MRPRAILIAEDSEDDRYLLAHAFEESGCEYPVRIVEDGRKVIAYLAGAGEFGDRERYPEPALLLLDVKMPFKDGFETLEEIRRLPRRRFLPVLMLSASSQPQDIERGYALGAQGYLVKPAEYARLADMMKAVVDYWLRHNRTPVQLDGEEANKLS